MIAVIKMSKKNTLEDRLGVSLALAGWRRSFPKHPQQKMNDHNNLIQEHADTGEGGRTGEAPLGVGHGESDHST